MYREHKPVWAITNFNLRVQNKNTEKTLNQNAKALNLIIYILSISQTFTYDHQNVLIIPILL